MAFQSGISNSWDPIQAVRSLTELSAPLDWKETPNAHVFLVDLPGTKRDGVKVEVAEGNILQISGERKEEGEGKDDTWHRKERSGGPFLRKLRLPENANVDQVKAGLANGVLTVTVPKIEESKKAEVKNIEIFGGDAKKGDKNKMSKKKGMLLCCGLGD